ncbi:MAG: hypothetical protein IKL36_03540 [Clostridia bacterium]|nr:hypothetical protein [Clostridia bacterium]
MPRRHKEVIYVGYGVTLKTGLHRFPILCYEAEFLRVFPYLFHHSKDFFFGRNIYHSGSGKINIYLARRLYFDSYYSFVITDFFEGLHHGHYPRQCGIQNMQFVEYYRQYADEDSEESREEVAHDNSSEPDKIFINLERIEAVMTTFENLNYRERAMVSAHLGFCMECYATHFYDKDDLDEDGKPIRKPIPEEAFIDIAIDHGLA